MYYLAPTIHIDEYNLIINNIILTINLQILFIYILSI